MSPLGRPRNPELDDAAIRAAIELIVEDGYPALTMERIAGGLRSVGPPCTDVGPTRSSSCRRHRVLGTGQGALPDTGRLRDDFVEFLAPCPEPAADVEAYEALIAAAAGDPELGNRCRQATGRFSDSFRTIVTRAVDRGELPADTDIELLADVVPALALYRAQTTGQHLDEEFIDRMAEQFFTPANATPATKTSTMTEPGLARPPS